MVDPVLVGMVGIMLTFIFVVYLFLRRILTGFKEGVEQGRNS